MLKTVNIKKIFLGIFPVLALSLFLSGRAGADTFAVTLPANTEVTMQDPSARLPFTVTNNSATKDIREITFTVNSSGYLLSAATAAPPGWCVKAVNTLSVTFSLLQGSGCSNGANGSEIPPGGSLVFTLTVTPLSSSADVTGETLSSVTVGSQAGFTLSGALPAWTRRALAAVMSATPSSTAAGNIITLSMQVTNRSTATKNSVTATPSPPSPSSAIVTNTGGPYFGSTSLNGSITGSDATITAGSTSEFSSSGTIKIESEEVCYTAKTATAFTGLTRGCNGTTATNHTNGTIVYNLTPFSLAPGASGTISYTYSANLAGSVYFTSKAKDALNASTSLSVNSNTVVIGSFTAALTLSPATVVSGQTVTVEMDVTNNNTGALVNILPTVLTACAGGATETLSSGPSPSGISSLAGGSTGSFIWNYLITGSVGQAYCLSGGATADGPLTTNTGTSNAGTVSAYSVTVTPQSIPSGGTNRTFTWNVYNGSGCTVKEVDIATPSSGGNWSCSSVTAPSGWSASCGGTVQFISGSSSSDIVAGGAKSFSITFSTTETVISDKTVSFPVAVTSRGCGSISTAAGSSVTVTAFSLALSHYPAGPVDADGSSGYNMTAVLSSGPSFISGKTIAFTTTNGTLTPASATTDANGQAVVFLTGPYSTVNTSSTVGASYLNASATDTVSFSAWTKPNLVYWGGLAPASTGCAVKATFQVTVKNISSSPMNITTGSYLAFNDYSSGGCSTYKAFLDSGSTGAISGGATKTLSFGSPTDAGGGGGVSVSEFFIPGSYTPLANSAPPPFSGLFFTEAAPPGPGANDQYRSVTDSVTLFAGCGAVKMNTIEWRELR